MSKTTLLFLFFCFNLIFGNTLAIVENNVEISIEITAINKMFYKEIRNYEILNEEGINYSNFIEYYDESTKITFLNVLIVDRNNQIIKRLDKKDFSDESAVSSYSLYEDSRKLTHLFIPTSYPIKVRFEVQKEMNNTSHIPSFSPIDCFNKKIEKFSYTIKNSSGIKLNKKEYNFNLYEEIKKSEEQNTIKFYIENLQPIHNEAFLINLDKIKPYCVFGLEKFNLRGRNINAQNWETLGKDLYNNLFSAQKYLDEKTKFEIRNLVKNLNSDKEKVVFLYDYLQKNTRYVSIQIGIGGFQPMSATEVHKKKYGDCKGLSNYMIALLEAVGIKANYVIISANSNQKSNIEKEVVVFSGNHMIVQVELKNEKIWLECTSRHLPINHLGNFSSDRECLIISDKGGKIEKTPEILSTENTETSNYLIKIIDDGYCEVKAENIFKKNQYETLINLSLYPQEKQIELIKSKYSNFIDLEVSNFAITLDTQNELSKLNFNLKGKNITKSIGNDILISTIPFNRFEFITSSNTRNYPIEIPFGYFDTYNIVYELNDNLKILEKPENINITSTFGNYNQTINIENNKLKIKREFQLKTGEYPKENAEDFFIFLKMVSKSEKSKLLISKQ